MAALARTPKDCWSAKQSATRSATRLAGWWDPASAWNLGSASAFHSVALLGAQWAAPSVLAWVWRSAVVLGNWSVPRSVLRTVVPLGLSWVPELAPCLEHEKAPRLAWHSEISMVIWSASYSVCSL